MRGCIWTLRGVRFGRTWTLGTNSGARPGSTEVPQIQFIDFVLSWSTSSCARPRRLLESVLFLGFARAVRTWKMVHYSPTSCIWQPFLGVWVLHVDHGTLDFSGDDFVRGAIALFALGVRTIFLRVDVLEPA